MNNMLNTYKITIAFGLLFFSFILKAQTTSETLLAKHVNGTVYDASTKLPIEGLKITAGNDSSVFTDSLGAFSIISPSTKITISASGMGYQAQIIPIKERSELVIYMHEENFPSKEQLFTDFYSPGPIALTNKSVSTISNTTNNWRNPGLSLEDAMGQKLNGLTIISRSGTPGIGSNMYLHGFSSLYGSNQPLIVIDGFVFDVPDADYTAITGYVSNPLSFVDNNDIENISLIKDASSLYGSQSGNGVIFITTRHSKDVATKIDFNILSGINYAPKQIPMLESDDYRRYLTEILQTSGLSADSISSLPYMNDDPENKEYFKYHNNTNWQDQIFTEGSFQKYNLRISGGDAVALYTLSVGYTNHEGILRNTGFNRYNARFNADIKVSPRFLMNAGVSFANNEYQLKEEGLVKTSPIHQSLYKSPFLSTYVRGLYGISSPVLEDADIFGVSNPLAITDLLDATSDNYQIFGLFNATYKISKDFAISDQINIDFHKSRNNLFVPHRGITADTLDKGVAENEMAHQVTRLFNISNDMRIKYFHSFGYVHNVSATAGIRLRALKDEDDWGMAHNSPNDEMKTINTGSAIFRSTGGDMSDINRLTYYLASDYNYAQKYFVSANFVLDGSSLFGDEANGMNLHGNKFGIFPSVAFAWLASSESFMANIDAIDLLKARFSYGKAGNSDLSNYPSIKYYVSQNFLGSQGLVKGSLWNPTLQWEDVLKTNVGADLGILKNRVQVTFDYFSNSTKNMLNIIDADPQSGFSFYVDNNGSFESKGIDLSLFIRPIDGSNFKWDIALNYSKYRTKIIELPVDKKISTVADAKILSEVGNSLGVFYGYKVLGVYSTQADAEADGLMAVLPNTDLVPFGAGDIKFDDKDGNHIIDERDMQVIGDPNPDFTGMLSNKISWKGISLEAVISISQGKDVFNHLRYQLESMKNTDNQTQAILNRWKIEGQITDIPKAQAGDPKGNSRFSDRWIEDGSYVRLKYLTLSYNVPFIPKYIRGIEVFVTGQNLITLSDYLGYDPEFSISGFSLAQGIDLGLTPQSKSVYAGIKVNF